MYAFPLLLIIKVIYYLRNDDVQAAFELIKDLEPTTPQEYILKGVVSASVGQSTGSREHLKMAQQYFQVLLPFLILLNVLLIFEVCGIKNLSRFLLLRNQPL
jgi:hypothetical protein